MTNERELLEQAAKALGYKEYCHYEGTPVLRATRDGHNWFKWDPIGDLDHRYQLLRTLKMTVSFDTKEVYGRTHNGYVVTERWGNDHRDEVYAILKVAAEIGRSKS